MTGLGIEYSPCTKCDKTKCSFCELAKYKNSQKGCQEGGVMATPWRSEEERNEYFEKLKLEDSVKTSLLKLAVKEFDNMICEEVVAVLKKYFPNSAIDEQKVLKLARMLIAEEKNREVRPYEE